MPLLPKEGKETTGWMENHQQGWAQVVRQLRQK
jgi:hypothetical protein